MPENETAAYQVDLTDEECEIIKPLIPAGKWGDRHREVDLREMPNAIFMY